MGKFSFENLWSEKSTDAPRKLVNHAEYDFAVAYPPPEGVPMDGLIDGLKTIVDAKSDEVARDMSYYPHVQGEESLSELVHAFELVSQTNSLDVVILARGGGSNEDLQSFNTELLARAIFTCSIPVVSAIGHETDITISDLVADVRAATPSAAAEIVMPDQNLLKEQIINSKNLMLERISSFVGMVENNLRIANHSLSSNLPDFDSYKLDIDTLSEKTITSLEQFLHLQNLAISNSRDQLNSLSPANTLNRGYSVVHDSNNQIVTDPNNLVDKEHLKITVKSGSFGAVVQKPPTDT